MQIKARYSHLNGEEYLIVHRKELWEEVQAVIAMWTPLPAKPKSRKKRPCQENPVLSPDMNRLFKDGLEMLEWSERRNTFWVTDDEKLLRGIYDLPESQQKKAIEEAGLTPIMS